MTFFKEILSVTLILFSVIDILGSIPVIIGMQDQGKTVEAGKTALASGLLMVLFLFIGERILLLFGVDIQSFAIAGALIIFLIGLEMVLGRNIFKAGGDIQSVSIVPLAFPLIAGAGTMTTIISLKAEFQLYSILVGIVLNLILIYIVLRSTGLIARYIGPNGIYMLHKVFGIILLAIAIKLFKTNAFPTF